MVTKSRRYVKYGSEDAYAAERITYGEVGRGGLGLVLMVFLKSMFGVYVNENLLVR